MNQAFKIRCPLPHCTGWVTQLDPEDGSLFMCDDCGQVWETKAELDAAIAAIIERFPYRAAVASRRPRPLLRAASSFSASTPAPA